jgi:hypothetical protein
MPVIAAILAIGIIGGVLWDAFETMVLPRRIARRFRLSRLVFIITWRPWSLIARRTPDRGRRERMLGPYGPLALIILLVTWAVALIFGYALLQWAIGSRLQNATGPISFWTDVYLSGTTFFTLGLGDVTPLTPLARALTVLEGGTGFGVLALVIGYLPVMYQAFSRREVNISLLDARAGSPPTAFALLRRHCLDDRAGLTEFLHEWERWAAELLESHLSYNFLGFFRSQHDNQSWVAALTMMLDATALVIVGIEGIPVEAARLTFAMARHAAVDLSQVFTVTPDFTTERLSPARLDALIAALQAEGIPLRTGPEAMKLFATLRREYEPYLLALGRRLLMELPPWLPAPDAHDAWEITASGE